ncbi:MAG: AI-2E family transporter [Kiloniellales bacterium]|nr:AI-2E family transporter [Kiloniellales bacterium]
MTIGRELRFWLVGIAVFFLVLYLFRSVLLPFVAGMAVAYFLDPVCDRLETYKLSRTLAVSIVSLVFALLVVAVLLLLLPLIVNQVVDLAEWLPGFLNTLRGYLADLIVRMQDRIDPALADRLRDSLSQSAGTAVRWVTDFLGGVLRAGFDFANFLSLLVITPIVAFYLLRDWDRLVQQVDDWLPRQHAEEIREELRRVDETLAGFLRGQASVCLLLGVFYSIGLSLAGLSFGLIIGLIAGLLSFIPYVGSIVGLGLSVGLAFVQFDEWYMIGIVAAIFVIGQVVEGNFLTPKLVGERVGLHPVWVIFALLAGGALFGFLGILLAVPVAAVLGVLVRFFLRRYLDSGYYQGRQGTALPDGGEAAQD